MADALTSQVIEDGPRNAVLKFTNVSDGTGQTDAILVDVSTLSSDPLTGQVCNGVVLQGRTYSNVGIPNSGAAGKTGDILVTTSNAGSGDTYLLILTLTKTYASV